MSTQRLKIEWYSSKILISIYVIVRKQIIMSVNSRLQKHNTIFRRRILGCSFYEHLQREIRLTICPNMYTYCYFNGMTLQGNKFQIHDQFTFA